MRFSSGAPERNIASKVTNTVLKISNRKSACLRRYSASLPGLPSLQGIDGQAAQQLRIEVGGLLRQDFPGKRDVAHLAHADRIHQERDVRISATHAHHCFGCIADIADIALL